MYDCPLFNYERGENLRKNADKNLSEVTKYYIFSAYGFTSIIFAFIVDSPVAIFGGLLHIIKSSDILITDYIAVGGIGAAFLNSGLITLISLFLLKSLHIKITGITISTIWLLSGYALFGINIFNIWFPIIGVYLYAKFQKDRFTKYIYFALLGSSLSPIVTQIIFLVNLPLFARVILGSFTGVTVGFFLSPLATYLLRMHQGFNLSNIGFTAGIIGTICVALFKSFGWTFQKKLVWSTGYAHLLIPYLFFIFFSLLILGYYFNQRSLKRVINLFNYSGRLITDFVLLEGFGVSLINMSINGLLSFLFILVIGGSLNGPTVGGILTIIGFSSFGKHPKNITPIFLGILLGGLINIWKINDPIVQLSALFGSTLAPIAGEFGWSYGILAGFIHSSVVLNVGYLHGGFNLLNNGFSGGLVAAFLIPIIEALRKDDNE